MTEKLVHVIIVSAEPFPEGEANIIGCVAAAFPEQIEMVDPASGSFMLRDKEFKYSLAWGGPYADQLTSWIRKVEKGVHDLPRKGDIDTTKDFERGYGLWPLVMANWVERVSPDYATSTAYTRKWSVVAEKFLVIGIYHRVEEALSRAAPTQRKYCVYCGASIAIDAAYCAKCGKKQ